MMIYALSNTNFVFLSFSLTRLEVHYCKFYVLQPDKCRLIEVEKMFLLPLYFILLWILPTPILTQNWVGISFGTNYIGNILV